MDDAALKTIEAFLQHLNDKGWLDDEVDEDDYADGVQELYQIAVQNMPKPEAPAATGEADALLGWLDTFIGKGGTVRLFREGKNKLGVGMAFLDLDAAASSDTSFGGLVRGKAAILKALEKLNLTEL